MRAAIRFRFVAARAHGEIALAERRFDDAEIGISGGGVPTSHRASPFIRRSSRSSTICRSATGSRARRRRAAIFRRAADLYRQLNQPGRYIGVEFGVRPSLHPISRGACGASRRCVAGPGRARTVPASLERPDLAFQGKPGDEIRCIDRACREIQLASCGFRSLAGPLGWKLRAGIVDQRAPLRVHDSRSAEVTGLAQTRDKKSAQILGVCIGRELCQIRHRFTPCPAIARAKYDQTPAPSSPTRLMV